MLDALRIVQQAAARIGVEAPQSLDDIAGTDPIELVYGSVVDFCLDLHPWDFCRATVSLSQLAEPGELGYRFVYQLPAEAIGEPLRILADVSRPNVPYFGWTLSGRRILANAEPLFAVINTRPQPSAWPATFREAVVLALAAELSLSLAANEDMRLSLRRDAFGTPTEAFRGGAIGAAIRNQAFRTPVKQLPFTDPLSAAWRGGGW